MLGYVVRYKALLIDHVVPKNKYLAYGHVNSVDHVVPINEDSVCCYLTHLNSCLSCSYKTTYGISLAQSIVASSP